MLARIEATFFIIGLKISIKFWLFLKSSLIFEKFFVLVSVETLRIMETVKAERPREKALRFGLDHLSDQELLMLLISSGQKNRPVEKISYDLLEASSHLEKLFSLRYEELVTIKGISTSKAMQILAALELSKRALRKEVNEVQITTSAQLVDWFKAEYGSSPQENLVAVYLDAKQSILYHEVIFKGTLNNVEVHPREIFRQAFLKGANSLIIMHNHPSGSTTPSKEDIDFTRRLIEVSNLMGIHFLDHVIVSSHSYLSFREKGFMLL